MIPVALNFTDGNLAVPARQPFNEARLVRAILGGKFTYSETCPSEKFVCAACGAYEWIYAVPIIIIASTLLIVWATLELYNYYLQVKIDIPMTSREWYEFYEKVKFVKDDELANRKIS